MQLYQGSMKTALEELIEGISRSKKVLPFKIIREVARKYEVD